MAQNISKKQTTSIAPEAHLRVSKDGYSFDINSNLWTLNKDTTISFQNDILNLDPITLEGFRKTLAYYAEELSAKHTHNMYHRFQRMIRDTNCQEIDEYVIRNWRTMLDKEHEWYLGALRGFLISWYDYGYKGITASVVKALETIKLSGNQKGVAVANRCPYTGAFTQNEQIAIANELIRQFKENEISLACYSYLCTLQATARRAIQIRQLKAIDIEKEHDTKTNTYNYYLNIPRAKQRNTSFRSEFKKLAITEDLYLTLLNLVNNTEKKLSLMLGQKLAPKLREKIPVFIDWSYASEMLNKNTTTLSLDEILDTDILHASTTQLKDNYMRDVCKSNRAVSERTGDIILLSARRFRRTRGTNLGRKGVAPAVIAEALDHSDTQNVAVYAENTADTVTHIDKAVGKQLAPFAKAFKGEFIEHIADGERGNDKTAHIPNKDNEIVGACGTNDFCIRGYEACYLCEKFRPLLDAPHEKFLEGLYAEKEVRLKATKSEEYASTKDTLILAVEYVVQACADINKEKAGVA